MPDPKFNAALLEEKPVSDLPQPSHRDLYLMLGELSGQLKTVVTMLQEKRAEITELRTRVGELEKKAAVGVFLVIGISLIVPVTTTTITNSFTSQLPKDEVEEVRVQLARLKRLLKDEDLIDLPAGGVAAPKKN